MIEELAVRRYLIILFYPLLILGANIRNRQFASKLTYNIDNSTFDSFMAYIPYNLIQELDSLDLVFGSTKKYFYRSAVLSLRPVGAGALKFSLCADVTISIGNFVTNIVPTYFSIKNIKTESSGPVLPNILNLSIYKRNGVCLFKLMDAYKESVVFDDVFTSTKGIEFWINFSEVIKFIFIIDDNDCVVKNENLELVIIENEKNYNLVGNNKNNHTRLSQYKQNCCLFVGDEEDVLSVDLSSQQIFFEYLKAFLDWFALTKDMKTPSFYVPKMIESVVDENGKLKKEFLVGDVDEG